jgi:drug/metabolite transporter (DMT)-like permease
MSPNDRLQDIRSMLAAGHRCVHLERSTLLLLGGVGGFLSVVTEWVITDTRFPDLGTRGVALLVWLAFWLGGVSLLEYRLTCRARERRAETLPFAQAQVTRAWWMLLSVGCLGSFAMFFYGGGSMIYTLWTVLLGLGVYFFGLFSRPLIEWIGLATILLGVAALAAGLPYGGTRWLAASAFALGLPLAGWLNSRVGDAGIHHRTLALGLWLVLVVTPALLMARSAHTPSPAAAPLALGAQALGTGEQVLRLEAGTPIPLRLDLDSAFLRAPSHAELAMTLTMPMEVVLSDGEPDGRYRFGNGQWRDIRDGVLSLHIDRLRGRLEDGLPVVRAHARVDSQDFAGGDQ